jgi:ribonuclease H / adenosylcobalamin/alpha-ribazole phosphatase
MKPSKIKQNIQQALFEKLGGIDTVISVTIVGSFINHEDLTGISDIDTIVICNSLDKKLFDDCLNAARNLDLDMCGLDNYTLKINHSFGPLKFDKPNLAVLHLMIYDINSHRRHVLASPFTCFDWEKSEIRVGPSLKEIFPAGKLQFRDFTEVRRSLENYIDDLENKVISYREYDFKVDEVVEIKKNKPLDKRHQGEYSYHIVRNIIANYLKLFNNKNESYSNNEIRTEIKRLFYESGDAHIKMFDMISKIKHQREDSFPEHTMKWVKTFLIDFQQKISMEWSEAVPVHFLRHYKTNLNNGSYLGQGRDPDIDKSITAYPRYEPTTMVYSSPMRRCLKTAAEIWKDSKIMTDDRLLEFDYGRAEAMHYDQLVTQYPEISTGWQKGEDPCFPEGENTADVFGRLTSFLDDLSNVIDNQHPDSISIVTHNGLLRCLLGNAFGLDQKDWYKLVISHGVQLDFLYWRNCFYPNIPRQLWGDILQNIGYLES